MPKMRTKIYYNLFLQYSQVSGQRDKDKKVIFVTRIIFTLDNCDGDVH